MTPVLGQVDVTVSSTGEVPAQTYLVVERVNGLNANVLDRTASPGWSCTDQPLLPPYDDLVCIGPELAPGEQTELRVWSWLPLSLGAELVVQVATVEGGEPTDRVEIPVYPPIDGPAGAGGTQPAATEPRQPVPERRGRTPDRGAARRVRRSGGR